MVLVKLKSVLNLQNVSYNFLDNVMQLVVIRLFRFQECRRTCTDSDCNLPIISTRFLNYGFCLPAYAKTSNKLESFIIKGDHGNP